MTTRRVKGKTKSPTATPERQGRSRIRSPVPSPVLRDGGDKEGVKCRCGNPVVRTGKRGPMNKYCSAACRQRKYQEESMVTFKCPDCAAKVRVLSCVSSATCDANGKHRQKRMVRS